MATHSSAEAGAGCMLIIGFVAVAIAIGCFFGAAWGWLVFGLTIIVFTIMAV